MVTREARDMRAAFSSLLSSDLTIPPPIKTARRVGENGSRSAEIANAMMVTEGATGGGGGDQHRHMEEEVEELEEMEEEVEEEEDEGEKERWRRGGVSPRPVEIGKPLVVLLCGSLVYYHCAYRKSTFLSLVSDVFIVLLSSLAILGMLFRQMNIAVPVDPLEWQLSPDSANCFAACLANTIGAAESVLRVAASGHDKRLFLKVVGILYVLSCLGRLASGASVAYAGLCLFCSYMFAKNLELINNIIPKRRESYGGA